MINYFNSTASNHLASCVHRRKTLFITFCLILSTSTAWPGAARAADLATDYQWKPIKIGGGGWVTGLIVHPDQPDLVYARTDVGGVYRWNPAKSSWRHLIVANSLPKSFMEMIQGQPGIKRSSLYHVETIGIAPSDPRILFVGAGTSTDSPGVLLRSRDHGVTFEITGLTVPMAGNAEYRTSERIAVHSTDASIVLYGSRTRGLWRSEDGGINWSQVPVEQIPVAEPINKNHAGVLKVIFDATHPGRAYASVAGVGIYRSDDTGQSWQPILSDGLWAEDMETSKGILYAAGKDDVGLRRYDPETGWTTITPNNRRNLAELAVDPNDPAHLYTVTGGFQQFFRSTDSGASWTTLKTSTLNPESREHFQSPFGWKMTSTLRHWLSIGALVFDPHQPGRLWFAEGMGVWRSDDVVSTNDAPVFHDISDGIEELVTTDVVAMPGGKILTAAWDRLGFLHRDLDRGPEAQLGLTDDFNSGWSLATTPANPDFVAMTVTHHINHSKVFSGTSSDGGVTWQRFSSVNAEGKNKPEGLRFGEMVVAADRTDNLVWHPRSSEKFLRYSTDGGATWNASNIELEDWHGYFFGNRRRLAADGALPGTFYLHQWKPGSILVSTNHGAIFTDTGGRLTSWTHHSQLKGVPGRAGHLWFAHGRDFPARNDALSHSSDSGVTWTPISFFDQAWAFGFGKAATSDGYPTLFVYGRSATDSQWGVWRSSDEGATWDRIAEFPLGIFDVVMTVAGDPDIFGRVYIGWSGNGFAYGQPK
jgi:hypothetical protein